MAKPRRAERERTTNNDSAEHVRTAGSNSESEGNQQQQPNLSNEDRNVVVIEPESAKQPESSPGSTGNGSNRSRPRSGTASRKFTVRIDPQKSKEGLTVLLTGIHAIGAKLVHECLALDKTEATQLSEAIFTVNELYDGGFISPKAAAWGNLLMCAGSIYGPRALVMLFKKKLATPEGAAKNG